ncbi:uncharacterized protein PAE49_020716 isoform 2-T2 [Odontesthes bonariensis]|uniref:uncharacterized protein LOC142381310 isoform X2 n=1 Tax=Odontesthes bonariensis TaxID=219752 RepID=UPI003F589BC6
MSESIRRRNSSKQLLQNLIRVTAQRSQEDAEEVERERRRRARELQSGEGSPSRPEPPQHSNLTHNMESDEGLKPSCCLVLDEDEGFSDWSHRLENRTEHEAQEDCRVKEQRPSASADPEKEKEQGAGEEDGGEPRSSEEASTQPPEKTSSTKNALRTSYSSSVFLSQEARLQHAAGRSADRTSYLAAGTMKPRGRARRVDGEEEEEEDMQRELESAESARDEDQEEEELRFTHEEKADLHIRREQRHQVAEKEEQRKQNERTPEGRGRRSEEANRSEGSLCSSDGEESLNCYGPMSPTFKKLLIQFYPDEVNSRVSTDGKCTITERAESLKRSSGTKKTLPPVSVSKIDKKLEQYTHALEVSSKEGRSSCQVADLTPPSEPVALKKNLFEAGEAWNQSIIAVTLSKDADALKVGVADLINQWVKGGEDGSRCSSPSKPAEIKPGGVLNKKNLWESLGDTLSSSKDGKESSTKRYKFVVTGHGKYEKVCDDYVGGEDEHCQAAGQYYEDL